MLMQSSVLVDSPATEITLLPTLPAQWPSGSVNGLKARGGYTVDMTWKNGVVTETTIKSVKAGKLHLLINGKKETYDLKAHHSITIK